MKKRINLMSCAAEVLLRFREGVKINEFDTCTSSWSGSEVLLCYRSPPWEVIFKIELTLL